MERYNPLPPAPTKERVSRTFGGLIMRHTMAGISLALSLGLLTAAPAFTQTRGTVANVYVQSKVGVFVYNADTSGRLTLVKGSAFADTGQMEAVRGQDLLISVGADYLHAYKLGANGAVGQQVAQINTQSYAGSECGTTNGAAILDHTGQYFSVDLWGTPQPAGTDICSAWQTYKLASNGEFTFLGDSVTTSINYKYLESYPTLSTYSSNDKFAYGAGQSNPYDPPQFHAYQQATAGDLVVNPDFSEVDPIPNPAVANSNYYPWLVAADPANHLAVIMDAYNSSNPYVWQLASYTLNNSTGAIVSTNTFANMPTLQVYPLCLQTSPDGAFAAVGGETGLQLFRFNGAAPPTTLGSVQLPNVEIDAIAWDKSNHLYALSYDLGYANSTADLYVLTVTPTGITQAPGSPYKISGTGLNGSSVVGLVVVPTT